MINYKKRILLISANKLIEPYPVYPLGLSYISTYLKKRLPEFDIEIFDLNLHETKDLILRLENFDPKYVGISLRNVDDTNSIDSHSFIEGYKNLVDTVRKHSSSKIIIGGSAFSIFPKELCKYLNPDYGICGEGEESFYQLLCSLEQNQIDYNIEGLVYLKDSIIVNYKRMDYLRSLELSFEKSIIDYYWQKSGMLNIQTKRGCPHHCIYCSYPVIEGRKVRTLDIDEVVKTLSDLYLNHGIDYVFFSDSVFNIMNDYNCKLAEKIIESKIKVNWGAYFSPHNLDEDMLRLFKRAGLTHIEFGTETISDQQLKNYGKHFTVDDILEKSELCNKVKVNFAHFLILCGFGETEDTLCETFENSKKIKSTIFFPYIGMRIYPRTKLAELAVKENVVDAEDDLLTPRYFISNKVDISTIKERAKQTGGKWIFPDEDNQKIMNAMRAKKWKGPLWEYAKY